MVQRHDTNPPTEAQLLATLEALENERNVLIVCE
jgi:hypothetical protein